jgi:hypothetical protein
MLKWLTIIGSVVLIGTVILVARNDKFHDTEGKGYDIKCTESSGPPVTAGTLICTAEHSQKAKSGQYDPLWWHIFFAWPEGITALLLMLTLGAITWQAWETRKAAKATRAAVDTADKAMKLQEDTAKRQLRAYICITSSGVKLSTDGTIQAKIYFKNGGQTPAYDVRGWSYPLADPYPYANPIEDPPEDLPMPSASSPHRKNR